MPRASAPGKVVISGAYAVLRGTPAIVSAVDRRASADTAWPAEVVTEEVRAAIALGWLDAAPGFDASAQREAGRKLGLGSSAAILVASLLAAHPQLGPDQLFERALVAHRRAQGGGSGVDVAASVHGGTLAFQLDAEGNPKVRAITLPPGLIVEVWASPQQARTSALIASVQGAARRAPREHQELFALLERAGREALGAADAGDRAAFTAALVTQVEGLERLGELAEVPICTAAVRRLHRLAREQDALVLPSGAGGGDVCLYVGSEAPRERLLAELSEVEHERLATTLGAAGARLEPAHG